MKSYLVQTPSLVQELFPKLIWAFPNKILPAKDAENTVYLTFDDGPIPEVTPWVLELLKKYRAKATFFCIGDNIRKYPELFRRIISEGHAVGNHTFHHWNGWKTGNDKYINDILKAENEILANSTNVDGSSMNNRTSGTVNQNRLFRPPYGKLKSQQVKLLLKQGYHIIMWDVLSGDFDMDNSEEKCLQNVTEHLKPGSIVVFHDSLKAKKNLQYVLPKVLDFLEEKKLRSVSIE